MSTASCLCGQLQVRVSGEPVTVTVCNCSLCQKRSGAPFGMGSYWEHAQAEEITGASREFTRGSDSGRKVVHHFCPECGVTLYWYAELVPHLVAVAVGCFADPGFPGPKAVSYAPNKHHWVTFPGDIPHNEASSVNK